MLLAAAVVQIEVEGYYMQSIGMLLPTYHKHYWIGLTTNSSFWPRYNWTDRSVSAPLGVNYQHWGRAGAVTVEPNNATGTLDAPPLLLSLACGYAVPNITCGYGCCRPGVVRGGQL